MHHKDASIDFDAGAGAADLLDFSALSASNNVTVDLGAGTVNITGGSNGNVTGFDRLRGTDGADTLAGTSGDNWIWGQDGNDTIDGAMGDDILDGGAGDDTFVIANSDGNDSITGGTGTDTYDGSGVTDNMIFDLASSTVTAGAHTDAVSGIEKFLGGTGTNIFIGNNSNNWFDC